MNARSPRIGSVWTFQADGWDRLDRREHTPSDGARVRVTQPYGCPRNGTMGHCYVETLDGEFIGLVSISSLVRP